MLNPDYVTNFRLYGPLKTVLGYVGRGAAILPVYGGWKPGLDVNTAVASTLTQWRECLDSFDRTNHDWSVHKILACYNCAPCGVEYRPRAKFCNLAYLCPFCWGRNAQLASLGLYNALRALPKKYL